MPPAVFKKEWIPKVVYLIHAGWRKDEIYKELGISKTALRNAMIKYNLTHLKTKLRNKKKIDLDKLHEMYYEQQMPIYEIAEKLNVSENSIRSRLRDEFDGTVTDNKEYSMSVPMAIELYKEGLKLEEISDMSGYATTTLSRYIQNAGVSLRQNIDYKQKTKHEYITKNGDVLFLRSGWEVDVAKFLDKHNYNWKYEIQSYKLGDKRYHPDFFIYKENGELDFIIEVKGRLREGSATKMMTFQDIYPEIDYYVWDREVVNLIKEEVA